MAGMFAIILTFATFITGILWCLERYRWQPARQRKVEMVRQQTEGNIDGKILADVGKPNGIVDFFASIFPVLLFVFVIRSFIIEPFQIPSGSMMPTLLVGDFIAVEKYAYGIKDPITNTTIIPIGHPQRGDIAVFKYPNNPKIDYVKRVVGLPGDKIVYNSDSKQLRIYPACHPEDNQCIGQQKTPLDLNYSTVNISDWTQVFGENASTGSNFYTQEQFASQFPANNKILNLKLNQRQETLGDKVHDILLLPINLYQGSTFYRQPGQQFGEWIVPAGHYFMLGDNRDNSEDSRFWGFVPERNLVGRVSAIWLSLEKQPNEWPTGIRFSRIGGVN